MTTEELRSLAQYICTIPADQVGEFASILFDEIEEHYSPSDVLLIKSLLNEQGVDTDGICKKKHPS
jgi:hypothetical protein